MTVVESTECVSLANYCDKFVHFAKKECIETRNKFCANIFQIYSTDEAINGKIKLVDSQSSTFGILWKTYCVEQ